MVYEFKHVDDLVNGAGLDLSILNDLANNDDYFNRVVPNVSYRWTNQAINSNSGGATRISIQGGTILLPQFMRTHTATVNLNRVSANNLYPITVGLRSSHDINATTLINGCTSKGFTVLVKAKSDGPYNGIYLTWIALVPLSG